MKGGISTATVRVNVGLPEFPAVDQNDFEGRQLFYISGRITDQFGNPIDNARVFIEGLEGTGDQRGNSGQAFTDKDGRYVISGLEVIPFTVAAYKSGWRFIGVDDAAPLPSSITSAL